MAIPTYDQFIEPVLRFLATRPDGALAREVYEAAADAMQLTDEERAELLPSQAQQVYKNRIGWAHDRLKRAGLSSSAKRGFWCLTDEGKIFAASNVGPLSQGLVADLAFGYMDVRLKEATSTTETVTKPSISDTTSETSSPEERLGAAVKEMRESVAADLLETLAKVSPTYFETIVLDLLHKMGYGANRNDLQRVGGSGDGGIDGVISLDKLGLEKVYVQAKRWQSSVGRPENQGFYGALAGQRATKGVFITTSAYTAQAVEFAKSVERIVLVDGIKLAELMIDHEVGVSTRIVKIPKFDSDYFED
ncbi:restriction endonuclease [Arsukibacterium indicum]|uniref:Restriction endonuclease n=1 Tax=Arsukibacterium indicum TaxID=2848612 RepID=A0ABS6MIQ8_9GAMM|nr:restriction endonuclease [Arsukibacterium indicum]MBV2128635.1 restriction endonuclease [Arsukibacterium indicum]